MIPTQQKIDKMTAQEMLDISGDEIIRLDAKRREEIGNGFR